MSEARLWQTLRAGISGWGHVDRIESHATSLGRPDINWCDSGQTADIELKVYDPRKNGFVLRAAQNSWALQRTKAGGRVYIFARFDSIDGPIFLLIPGSRSRALIHERSYEAWHKQAMWVWNGNLTPQDWVVFRNLVLSGTGTELESPN